MGQKIKIKWFWRKKKSSSTSRSIETGNKEPFFNREPVKRALRTFIQAAAGYIMVNVVALDFSAENAVKGFIISTIAAGISAVMNMNSTSNTGGETNNEGY